MSLIPVELENDPLVVMQTNALLDAEQRTLAKRVDKLFAKLLVAQWVVAVGLAFFVTPYTWVGAAKAVHVHVLGAFALGGALTAIPLWMIYRYPGMPRTRYTIAVVQMMWSALLIHLSGGRSRPARR